MIKIVLFGTGNVATHLFRAFLKADKTKVVQVYNHHPNSLFPFQSKVATTTSMDRLKKADLYLLAIKDDQIESTIDQLPENTSLIAHTSGTLPLLNNHKRNGVFYPLQTFSKNKEIDFSEVPVAVEASRPADTEILLQVGRAISKNVYNITTQQRKTLHLAAVFACNFTNALYGIAEDLCLKNELSFELLHPLILETAKKIKRYSPKTVQTGPAIRGDQKIIDLQLQTLNESPNFKEIYILLTSLIQNNDAREL